MGSLDSRKKLFFSALAWILLISPQNLVFPARISGFVTTDFTCYEPNDQLKVQFSTDIPTMQNWVGLYPADDTDRSTALQFQWSCGSHDVDCGTQYGNLLFTNLPTEPGMYIVVSKGYGYHGKTSQMESIPFRIVQKGFSCENQQYLQFDKSHYTTGESIKVSFKRNTTNGADSVAIFPVDIPLQEMPNIRPTLWQSILLPCRHRDCKRPDLNLDGSVKFGTFDLPTGKYVAVLGVMTFDGNMQPSLVSPMPFSFVQTNHCHVTVSTSSQCYAQQEDIPIHFDTAAQCRQLTDRMAIYPAHVQVKLSVQPSLWLYTCGTEHCIDQENTSQQYLPTTMSLSTIPMQLQHLHHWIGHSQ